MKMGVGILLLFMSYLSYGQGPGPGFSTTGRSAAANNPEILSRSLTSSGKSELEKVRSIFYWITDNISYRVASDFKRNKGHRVTDEDTAMEWKSGNEMTALMVLKNRKAYCEGYARLFKTLCEYAGIRSEVITGYARTNRGKRFLSNHSWNAVRIDSSWYLLDATWASGYISYGTGEFVRQYDGHYFLTPPKAMIRDHFPEDLRWTLLDHPPVPGEFHQSPLRHSNYIKYSIDSYFPSKGIIEASVGDTIAFELRTSNAARDKRIASDPFFDSSLLNASASWVFLLPEQIDNKKTLYLYPVTNHEVEWLHLLYNDDVVLKYRLNIKPDKDAEKTASALNKN